MFNFSTVGVEMTFATNGNTRHAKIRINTSMLSNWNEEFIHQLMSTLIEILNQETFETAILVERRMLPHRRIRWILVDKEIPVSDL